MKGFEQAQKLGNQVLANPSLLNQLDEELLLSLLLAYLNMISH